MSRKDKNRDFFFLALLIISLVGLPLAMISYDLNHWGNAKAESSKTFTLTAHSKLGWVEGRVTGFDVLTLENREKNKKDVTANKVILRAKKGDYVVFKLTSSDVIHGFTLKDFNIFIEDGVRPGKVITASFLADKVGTYTFSCNIICGKDHEEMKGTLIITA